jgi:FtsH-binding integral membrane protein
MPNGAVSGAGHDAGDQRRAYCSLILGVLAFIAIAAFIVYAVTERPFFATASGIALLVGGLAVFAFFAVLLAACRCGRDGGKGAQKNDDARAQDDDKKAGKSKDESDGREDLVNTVFFLCAVGLVALIGLAVWAATRADFRTTFGIGVLVLGATALVGASLGFLFGIPKSVSEGAVASGGSAGAAGGGTTGAANRDAAKTDADGAPAAAGKGGQAPAGTAPYATNTNLEQISDWLTKIIVGVSLTQVGTIRAEFLKLAEFLAPALAAGVDGDGAAVAKAVAAIIIVYGLTGGFLAGYLLTRLFLTGALSRVERNLRKELDEKKTELSQKADELTQTKTALLESQSKIDEQQRVIEYARSRLGEIFNDLYRYSDQGFRQAIGKCKEILSLPGQDTNPQLWFYLAAGYGQAARWDYENKLNARKAAGEKIEELSKEEKAQVVAPYREKALTAVKNALTHGRAAWLPLLQLVWDPAHPDKVRDPDLKNVENDLEIFYGDPDFGALLGVGGVYDTQPSTTSDDPPPSDERPPA